MLLLREVWKLFSPFGIAVWQQPIPEQLPAVLKSVLSEHVDTHPPVRFWPDSVDPQTKPKASQPTTVNLLSVPETVNGDAIDILTLTL